MIIGIIVGVIYFLIYKFFKGIRYILIFVLAGCFLLLGLISPAKYPAVAVDVGSFGFVLFTFLIIDAVFGHQTSEDFANDPPEKIQSLRQHKHGKNRKKH